MKMYRCLKKVLDCLIALIALILTLPIWLITIIGIEISDPGPVFYRARRIGYQGREFQMYKFRSMRVPKNIEDSVETSFKADVNRIFPFGKLIRRLKIDELPQLINVIFNDMAIVGPRPASVDQVSIMREGRYQIANTVRPGLTGPAALYDYIYGDTIEDPAEYERLVLPTRRELEAYYPSHMSAVFDLKMIRWTVICLVASAIGWKNEKILDELTSFVDDDANMSVEQEHLNV